MIFINDNNEQIKDRYHFIDHHIYHIYVVTMMWFLRCKICEDIDETVETCMLDGMSIGCYGRDSRLDCSKGCVFYRVSLDMVEDKRVEKVCRLHGPRSWKSFTWGCLVSF